MSIQQYKSLPSTAVATTTEQEFVVNCVSTVLVANDALSGDLYISFGDSITVGNYAILKPGESFKNLPISADSIFVKSSTGTVNFRYFGLTNVITGEVK